MRIPIAATGALLLLCGASALALGVSGVAGHPPLDPALVRFASGSPWFLAVAAGVAEILALAGQLWLVVQGRTVVHQRWPDLDPQTRAHARAAADLATVAEGCGLANVWMFSESCLRSCSMNWYVSGNR